MTIPPAISRILTSSKYQSAILLTVIGGISAFVIYHSNDPNSHEKIMSIAKYLAYIWLAVIGATGLEDAAGKYNPPSTEANNLLTGVVGEVFKQVDNLKQDLVKTTNDVKATGDLFKTPTSGDDVISNLNKNREALGMNLLGPDGLEVPNVETPTPSSTSKAITTTTT